ncbi:MAG TPA: hypothetical protein VM890_02390, partial [Longimicrobium sp.]|nr:hypothetical protein [Longimicrobium sp.]
MAIRIVDTPEPLSAASYAQDRSTDLVSSSAGRLLLQELKRYCAREVKGRSFLVSGHRGAGKSTLVEDTVLTAWKEAQRKGVGLRPLLVPLDGPSLFPSWLPEPAPAAGGRPAPAADPAAAVRAAPGAGAGAAGPQEPARDSSPPVSPTPGPGTAAETQAALEQLTLGLHRALAREITAAFRQRVMEKAATGPLRDELLEVAAQLEMELYQCPSPARLREFWMLGGFLGDGVLFPPNSPNPFDSLGVSMAGQGLRELTAVAGMAEAYCRIAGKYTQTDNAKSASAESLASSASLELGKEFFTPLASLVAGLGVGGSVLAANGGPLGAAAAGTVAALGSGALFKRAWSRTQDRTTSRENSFIFDFTVATLDRVLPILIERLLNAGLAPVFVVDELDKVKDLPVRIQGMVHHLKKFVAENAFFCFLTDRTYYEEMIRGSASEAYPVEYTYYTHRLFIVFGHADLHKFIARRLEVPRSDPVQGSAGASPAPIPAPPPAGTGTGEAYEQVKAAAEDAADADVLPFVLLHRSRMHPVDLRRELATRRNAEGVLTLAPGALRTEGAYRQDLAVQVAVEIVLDREHMRARMEREPEFRRLAHDALYYLSRRWEE